MLSKLKYLFGLISQDTLINEEFKRVFGKFDYPFHTSDNRINKWRPDKRERYFIEASKIKNSSVYKQEINEVCRVLYLELATGNKSRQLYQGALLFANRYYTRIKALSNNDPVERDKSLEEASEKVEEYLDI